MNQSAAVESSTLPWSFRLAESSGVPLPLLWVGVFLTYFLVFFAYHNLTGGVAGLHMGERPFWNNPWGFVEFSYAAVLAWVPPFVVLVRRSARSNLHALCPTLKAHPSGPEWLGPASARYYRIAGGIGVGFALVANAWFLPGVLEQQRPEAWVAWSAWSVLRDAFSAWFVLRAWAVALSIAIHFYHLADRGVVVQLLNPRDLFPFARQGFRLALLYFIGIAFGSATFGLIPIAQTELFSSVAPLVVPYIVFAALHLYLPCAGARRAIVREKSVELDRVRAEIEQQRAMALSVDDESKTLAASRLPGLLAYETRVENVREWPINVFGLLRFLLYVAIPVGSWVASALVERLVTGALD